MKLPLYQCHKQVRAAKIINVGYSQYCGGPELSLLVESNDEEDKRAFVGIEWMAKHHPEVGGYYVQYEDGYTSYSPAKAFEDGYTLWPDVAATKRAIVDAGGPEDIPLGRDSTPVCLRVTRSDGTLLLELDEAGRIHSKRHSLEIENRVPERIVAAAAGGMDFYNLPNELRAVALGDVELMDFGKSLKKGECEWMTVRFLETEEDGGHALWAMEEPKALRKRLAAEQSVLRCLLFIADQVHREEEPEPPEDYTMQAQALLLSGWFTGGEVREKLAVDEGCVDGLTPVSELLPPKQRHFDLILKSRQHGFTSADAARRLAVRLGYPNLWTTPPEAIYLWAVDHGVADGLPDCYRVSVRETAE